MQCIICDSTRIKFIGKPRFNIDFPKIKEKKYRIVQCVNCKFYFIYPNVDLTQQEWSDLYGDDYFATANITHWQKQLHIKERTLRINLIKKYISNNNYKILDIGCGEGFVLKHAYENGFDPYGIDIAENLDSSVDRNKIKFHKGNIFNAKFPDDFFSAILMDSVLEHIEKPIPVLNEMYRILQPGGIALVMVPNEDSLINDIKKLLYKLTLQKGKYGKIKPFVSPYHINGFNESSLKYAFRQCEFEVIKLQQFGGNYTFWKKFEKYSTEYFRELILYPLGLLSILLKKQIQLQIILKK